MALESSSGLPRFRGALGKQLEGLSAWKATRFQPRQAEDPPPDPGSFPYAITYAKTLFCHLCIPGGQHESTCPVYHPTQNGPDQ